MAAKPPAVHDPDGPWIDIDYTAGGIVQVAETAYTVGRRGSRKFRTVRLVVRRTRLTDPAQLRLWPEWRHHAFITNRTDLTAVAADRYHRHHAVVELAIRDIKAGGAEHIPSGHYPANAAWFGCAVIAHNLTRWASILADQSTVTRVTFRTRITAVNRSRPTHPATPTTVAMGRHLHQPPHLHTRTARPRRIDPASRTGRTS